MYRISLLLACSGLFLWGCGESTRPTAEDSGTSSTTITANKPAPGDGVTDGGTAPQSQPADQIPQPDESLLPAGESRQENAAQRARREIGEAGSAGADWAADSKQQLVEQAEQRLSALDNQIAEMKQQAQDLQGAAKTRWEQNTQRFEETRQQYSEQLEKLKASSGDAWQQMSQGIANSYSELQQATKDAAAEFE